MIKSVHIVNFKIHEDSFLEFDTGLNIISGSSHEGKSAALKAIAWCLYNKPNGIKFKRKGSKGCVEVTITFDDGNSVTRRRSSTINEYIVKLADGTEEKFTALGMGVVPERVYEITQMADINYQTQFAEFFMLKSSGGAIAKQLNSMFGLEDIDKAVSNAASIIRKTNKELEAKKNELTDISEELDAIPDLSVMETKIERILSQEAEEKALHGKLMTITDAVDSLLDIQYDIDELPDYFGVARRIRRLESLLEEYKKVADSAEDLDEVVTQLRRIERQLANTPKIDRRRIASLETLLTTYEERSTKMYDIDKLIYEHERDHSSLTDTENFLGCKGIVDSLERNVHRYDQVDEQRKGLQSSIDDAIDIDEAAHRILAVIKRGKEQKEELVNQAGGICPVCEKPMGECNDCEEGN